MCESVWFRVFPCCVHLNGLQPLTHCKKLLRKCETKNIPSMVVDIKTMGTRIVVADQKESVFFVKYKPSDNALSVFCDDTSPRWCTSMIMLDYSTVCVADKFGNVTVVRTCAGRVCVCVCVCVFGGLQRRRRKNKNKKNEKKFRKT